MRLSKKIGLALACTMPAIAGCSVGFDQTGAHSTIEILERDSGAPLVGVDVTAGRLDADQDSTNSMLLKPAGRTNADGLVFIPTASVGDRGPFNYDGQLIVVVEHAGEINVLVLSNTAGARAAGDTVRIEVTSTNAEPPIAFPQATVGTTPPAVEVDALIGALWVCNVANGRLEEAIQSDGDDYVFLDSYILGAIPDAFIQASNQTGSCPFDSTTFSGDHVVLIRTSSGLDPFVFITYCVDDDTVIDCP